MSTTTTHALQNASVLASAIHRLSELIPASEVNGWLTERHPTLRGSPVDLIRVGRADMVFEEIERLRRER